MKFLVLAAVCLSVVVAGPTRGMLLPDIAGPIVKDDEINVSPVLIPENISNKPALVSQDISTNPALVYDIKEKPALLQLVIKINSKTHIIDIPVDTVVPEGSEVITTDPVLIDDLIKPDPVDIVEESISVGKPDIPLNASPADIGTPQLPGLDADNAHNIPDELKSSS